MGLITIGLLLILVVIFSIFGMVKSSDVYTRSISQARQSALMQQSLGTPITPSWWVSGSVTKEPTTGHASMTYTVTGPKGEATIIAEGTYNGTAWTMTRLEATIPGGQMVNLLTDMEGREGTPATSSSNQSSARGSERGEPGVSGEDVSDLLAPQPLIAEALWLRGIDRFRAGLAADDDVAVFEGIQDLEGAVMKDVNNRAAWIDLADAYLASRNSLLAAEAIEICENLLGSARGDRDLILARMASGYLQIDNTDAALALAGEALKEAPEERCNQVAIQLSHIAGMAGEPVEAIRILSERVQSMKNPAFGYLMLASLHELAGSREKAEDAVARALDALPPDKPLHAYASAELGRLSR